MKKRISLVLLFAILCGVMTLSAQKPFAGRIQFVTSVEGTDDPNVQASMAGISTEKIVMGNCMKEVVNQTGVGATSIRNGDYNVVYEILDISAYNMGKYYRETKGEDLQKQLASHKYDYEYTQETKTIAGYNCTKVIATITDMESDEESTVVYWVTNDLNVGANINFSDAPGLKGFPLATEQQIEGEGMSFTLIMTASEVKADKKIKAAEFYRPSDAISFDEMSPETKAQLGIPD